MAKTSGKPHRRAYVNPQPGFDEKEQRAEIEAVYNDIAEWYVESRSVKRSDFISQLRSGDEAVVARVGCLAKVVKNKLARDADLKEARGDINGQCAVLVSAKEGLRSDRDWPAMKAAAASFFLWLKNVANSSARKHRYTNDEIRQMMLVRVDKRYTNDDDRLAAVKRKKVKPPGRTWFVTTLPLEASKRGIEI